MILIIVVVVVAGPGQGKAGKTGPGQTKPRQGTTGKPAKPKQDFGAGPDKTRLVRQVPGGMATGSLHAPRPPGTNPGIWTQASAY